MTVKPSKTDLNWTAFLVKIEQNDVTNLDEFHEFSIICVQVFEDSSEL